MFINSTVFVLGAGASWHYGYPTGEGLVGSVISMADRLSGYCEQRLQSGETEQIIPKYVEQRIDNTKGTAGAGGWQTVQHECQLLSNRLKSVRPLLIDHFLFWNEDLREIGKLMIAAVILECEAYWLRVLRNRNSNDGSKPDDWYRFIVHKLVYDCSKSSELFDNQVKFITFNYDMSLEYHLFRSLTAIDLLQCADVEKFLQNDRIIHVYGSVRSQIPTDADAIDLYTAENFGRVSSDHAKTFQPKLKAFLDQCLAASVNLRTVDPHDKEDDEVSLDRARQWVADAGVVYILGYGFDRNNSRRIGLEPSLRNTSKNGSSKSVMFTNYMDINTINKSASQLIYGDYESFLGERQSIHGDPLRGDYVEKSVRTVYEALEKDFYPLEAALIASSKI